MSSAALKHDNRFFITISNCAKLRNVQHQFHSEPQSGVAAGTEDTCSGKRFTQEQHQP